MALISVADYTRIIDTLIPETICTYTAEDGKQRSVIYKSQSFTYRSHRLMPHVADTQTYAYILHRIDRGYDTFTFDILYNFTWGECRWVSLNVHQVARLIAF